MTTKVPVELSSTPGIVDNSNATAITIDSNEDVTVNNGTLTSSGANGVGNQGFHITDTGYSKTHKLFGDNSLHIQADSGQQILFKPNATEGARFQSNGNLLLNQTATADSGVADGRLEITRGSQHCLNCHVAGTGNSTLVAFINDNGFVGGINTNGSATAFNTSSDARLKNVLGEAKGLEIINALNPVNFEWKSDGRTQDGLIAQEVEKVFPEAVSEPELDGEWYSVDYSKLVTPMIKAIQEQQAQIEALQSEINTLKGE